MVNAIAGDLQNLEDGMVCFDHSLGEELVVFGPMLCVIGDNPRSLLLVSHIISAQAKQCCHNVQGKNKELN